MNLLDQSFTDSSPPRIWSPQQENIFEAVRSSSTNLLVQAVAGSGKTTTILEAMRYAGDRPIFLAFNKSIQTELAGQITRGEARTLNSLGFAACRANGCSNIETRKNSIHLEAAFKSVGLSDQHFRELGYSASRLVGLAKNLAVATPYGPDSVTATFLSIAEAYWMSFPEELNDSVCLAVGMAFDSSIKDRSMIDFDDQLYFPVYYKWELPQFSDAFIDECQDLSPIQHALLKILRDEGSRCIAVGDRHQAIYGFRGASHDSMDILKREFEMAELPLSTTYRCPLSVVAEAQRYCPDIHARESAPFGSVSRLSLGDKDPDLWEGDDWIILCRNNAPLFRAIMRQVRAKKPCRVLSNFLDTFQTWIKSFKTQTTVQLRAKLENWYQREREKAEDLEQWGKLAGIEDRYETLIVVMEGLAQTQQVIDLLKGLADGKRGPIFSTIHKAKGLEAEKIYFLRPDLIPSRWAMGDEAIQQEENLAYVGVTRAKDTLIYGAVKE